MSLNGSPGTGGRLTASLRVALLLLAIVVAPLVPSPLTTPAAADQDVAQGATITSCSTPRAGFPCANAIDGDEATLYETNGCCTTASVDLDLGASHEVTQYVLTTVNDAAHAGSAGWCKLNARATTLSWSDNGFAWTAVPGITYTGVVYQLLNQVASGNYCTHSATAQSTGSEQGSWSTVGGHRYWRVGLRVTACSCGHVVATLQLLVASAPEDQGSAHPEAFGLDPGQYAYSEDPVNLATGSFVAQATDLALPGRLLPLSFTRWYNSAEPTSGPLGPGWTHTYNWRLTDGGASVEIRRGDGRRDTFTRNPDGSYTDPPNVFDTLVKNPDGTFTLTLTSQVRYELSSGGALTRISEPAGNALTFAYTAGRLSTITDTAGRQLALAYDASDRLAQLEDPLGRRVTYAYDAAGRLATVTDKIGNTTGEDPALHRWTYGYDGASRHITTITDPDGRVRVTNTYDAQGRVVEQRDGLGALTQIAYGTGETTLTDPRGHATTYTFDSRMGVLSQIDQVGAATLTLAYAYDAAGNRTAVTDRRGATTDLTYDARGNVLTKTDPSPDGIAPRPVTAFAYDARSNLTEITDASGAVTTLAYDSATNVLLAVSRQIDATSSAVTKYEYTDPANPGLPTRVIAPRGNTTPTPDDAYATTLVYDAQGNLTSRTDPDSAVTTFAYDATGRLVSFVGPDGNAPGASPAQHTWTLAYDAGDRETSRTDPLGNTLAYAYDGAGNRASLTDRSGNVTSYAYDANTRLVTVQQRPGPVGQPALMYTTAVARDANGNATRIAQANGAVTDYAFDALDRLVSVTTYPSPPTPLVTSYTLDPNGQPLSRTSGDGTTVAYAYDALARLTSVTAPGLAPIGYAYDPLGRRTQMSDGTGVTTYAYDRLGRITGIAAPAGSLGYAYDRDGNRTALVYPGGDTVSYAYSPGGRLTSATDWAGRVSTYSYQPSGLVSGLAYPNGMTATYAYDRAQRLTGITNATATKTITSHAYTIDGEGNRTALDEFVRGLTVPPLVVSDALRVNDDTAAAAQDEPQLAVDPSGAAHLVWTDGRLSQDGAIFYARRDPVTGTWSPNERMSGATDPGTRRSPALAADATGNVYAVWQLDKPGQSGVDTDIWSARRDAATGTWSPETKVGEAAQGLPGQKSPRIAVSAEGAATALWLGYRNNRWEIVAADLSAGASVWGASVVATDGPAALRAAPDLALAPDGTAYAVWQDERSGDPDIYLATRAPGATSWSQNTRLDDDAGDAAQSAPRIAIDTQGNALAVWLDERSGTAQVRASRRLAGSLSWSASEAVSDPAARPAALSLAVRPDGHAAAVWEDARGATAVVFGAELSAIAGGSWSAPTQLSDTIAADQRRPAVALRTDEELLNEVVLAWRDDRRAEGGDVFSLTRTGAGSGLDHTAYAYDGLSRLVSAVGALPESWSFDAASNITSRTGPSATSTFDGANRLLSDAPAPSPGTAPIAWSVAARTRSATTRSADSRAPLSTP